MHILLALIFGAAYGGLVHALVPQRATRGSALAPMLGAALSGAVYAVLTWAGFSETDPLLWIAAVGAALVIVPLALAVLTRVRVRRDARERARLKIA
ncbi:MAG: hypothetical protein QM677_08365 [Microbacterium sp.]